MKREVVIKGQTPLTAQELFDLISDNGRVPNPIITFETGGNIQVTVEVNDVEVEEPNPPIEPVRLEEASDGEAEGGTDESPEDPEDAP
jgi:hypothetical protein